MRPGARRGLPPHDGARRARALAVLTLTVLLLHAALLGGTDWTWPADRAPIASLRVRTLDAAVPAGVPETAADPEAATAPVEPPVADAQLVSELERSPGSRIESRDVPVGAAAGQLSLPGAPARRSRSAPGALKVETAQQLAPEISAAPEVGIASEVSVAPDANVARQVGAASEVGSAPEITAAPEVSAAIGVQAASEVVAPPEDAGLSRAAPPPVYRTQPPPAATLHFAMRRGPQTGSAELQWQPTADGYTLRLDGVLAGVTVLSQRSQGDFDGAGLAPVRYTDRRVRRQTLATNFQRAAGKISFSGSAAEFPLLRGSQDRLSWMVQLAAIAAAEPQRLVAGGIIAMAVVGVRGEPALWTFRCLGADAVPTDAGPVPAVKLVRASLGPYDGGVDVWLDPARHHLPVRVVLRTGTAAQTLEFVLEALDIER